MDDKPYIVGIAVFVAALFAPPFFGVQDYDYSRFPWSAWSWISLGIGVVAGYVVKWMRAP